MVMVVVMLGAILMLVSYFLNIGGLLVMRAKLQTIAEFSAAGGGRVVAEKIAKTASDNVANGIFALPDESSSSHPEQFLTPEDRNSIQTEQVLLASVEGQARYYAQTNNTLQWDDVLPYMQVKFPQEFNACDGNKNGEHGRENTIEVAVTVYHEEPLFMERLAVLAHGSPTIVLTASSYYSVPLCP